MNSYSQAGQDKFAYEVLGQKKDGSFLDVGCHDGHKHSNSLGLEEIGWTGLLFDIYHFAGVEKRKSQVLISDAVTVDWKNVFEIHFPGKTEIDYLSLDVDQATTQTLWNLMVLPMRYRVLTVEHDAYRNGGELCETHRTLLSNASYELMCKNVCVGPGEWGAGGPFEDWWLCKELMTEENCRRFLADGQLGTSIVP